MKIRYVLMLLLCFSSLFAEEMRALWVPSWDLSKRDEIKSIVEKASKADINTLLVEVRNRSDEFYIPNR